MIPAELINDVNRVRTNFIQAVERLEKSGSIRSLPGVGTAARGPQEGPRDRRDIGWFASPATAGSSAPSSAPADTARRRSSTSSSPTSAVAAGWSPRRTTPRRSRCESSMRRALPSWSGSSSIPGASTRSSSSPAARRPGSRTSATTSRSTTATRKDSSWSMGPGPTCRRPTSSSSGSLSNRSSGRSPTPTRCPAEKLEDQEFIRALTIKELPSRLSKGTVLTTGGHAFHALQLRAIVKDVTLHDAYTRLGALCGHPPEEIKSLVFVDTPGLATASGLKDEVLRHCLEQKSNRIAIELWKEAELDVIVHLVLCGEQSNFATLWKAIEGECGPDAVRDLEERVILLVNGVNLYFENADLNKKIKDRAIARAEGDQFATTLVLQHPPENEPEGTVPAGQGMLRRFRSGSSRAASTPRTTRGSTRSIATAMMDWVEPGGVGRETLDELGLTDEFRREYRRPLRPGGPRPGVSDPADPRAHRDEGTCAAREETPGAHRPDVRAPGPSDPPGPILRRRRNLEPGRRSPRRSAPVSASSTPTTHRPSRRSPPTRSTRTSSRSSMAGMATLPSGNWVETSFRRTTKRGLRRHPRPRQGQPERREGVRRLLRRARGYLGRPMGVRVARAWNRHRDSRPPRAS